MADFPLLGGMQALSAGFVLATTTGTSITASASANTKGAYVELVSAANNDLDSNSIELVFDGLNSALGDFLVDISVGDAGFEEVVIHNVYVKTTSTPGALVSRVTLPISFQSGVRISARCQANNSSLAINMFIILSSGNFKQPTGFSEAVAYGDDEATSTGTLVARSSVGVFGSWVEITASTTDEIHAIAIASHRQGGSWQNGKYNYQVAVGSAGNEEVIISDILSATTASESGSGLLAGAYMVEVAIGQRLSIRAAASVADADFDNDYVIYGIK